MLIKSLYAVKVIILTTGEGSRMLPLRPNVMLPIANKPIPEHILDSAVGAGIRKFVFITVYYEDSIKEYFRNGSGFGVEIKYVHQSEQLDIAHAIGCARGHVKGCFIILYGDLLISPCHLKTHTTRKEDAVITVKEVENPSEFGVIETEGKKVVSIIEKPEVPPSSLANAGIYLFNESIFEFIAKTTKSMLLYSIKGDCKAVVEPNATLIGEIIAGEGTLIRNGAYIIDPVVIGRNCEIGPNCFIRPSTSIGSGVRIENAEEVKNIIVKGKYIDSGNRKLGVIMGDDVHTAINTCINVGTLMENGRSTKLGEVVR